MLQRLHGSPSSLTILRDALQEQSQAFPCPSCRVLSVRAFGAKTRPSEKKAPGAGGVSEQILSFVTGEFEKRKRSAQADIRKPLKVEPWKDQKIQLRQKAHTHIASSRTRAASTVREQQHDGYLNKVDAIKEKPTHSKTVSRAGGVSKPILSFVTGECQERRRIAQADIKKALRTKPWTDREVQTCRKAHTHIVNFRIGAAQVAGRQQHGGRLTKVDEIKEEPSHRRKVISANKDLHPRSSRTGHTTYREARRREESDRKGVPQLHNIDKVVHRRSDVVRRLTRELFVHKKWYDVLETQPEEEGWKRDSAIQVRRYLLNGPPPLKKYFSVECAYEIRSLDLQHLERSSEEENVVSPKPNDHLRWERDSTIRNRRHENRPSPKKNHSSGKSLYKVRSLDLQRSERSIEEETGVSPKSNDRLGVERDSAKQIRKYESESSPDKKYPSEESGYELGPLDLQHSERSSEEDGVVYTFIPSIDALKDNDLTDEIKTLGEDRNNTRGETSIETVHEQEIDQQNSWEPFNRIEVKRLTTDAETAILGDFEAGSTLELGEGSPMQELPSRIDTESTNIISCTTASSPAVPVHGKNWRTVLAEIEAWEFRRPSDSTGDTITLQLRQLACDFESWFQSAGSREVPPKRNDEILKMWRRHLMHIQDLPTTGYLADELWEHLLEFGFSNGRRLNEIVTYSIALHKKTGRSWERFYFKMIMHWLQRQTDAALGWHDTLYPMIHPTREQFIALVEYAYRSAPQSIAELQTIYERLPFRDLYSPIMQYLYQTERFMAAASWHDVFVACRDLPGDSQDYKPLFRHIILFGSQRRLAKLVDKMLDQQIPLPSFINRPMPLNPVSRDHQLAVTHGMLANTVGDSFYARLFATTWFSTETVIATLHMLGTDTLGSASLRELALKERSDPQAIRARLNQLREAGIALTNSNFCKLVEKLCEEENARVLENVIKCDLHPDTFENRDLQESLLGTYHASGQQLQFDRTLAILLINCPEKHHTTYYWNLHLRLHLKQKHLPSVMCSLQTMQASHLPLDVKSTSYVRVCLLARRRVGMRPRTTKELFIIINIWQSVLRSGSTMPAHVWVEILKRLGMTGQLEEYEKLALWLADWYSSSPARTYLGGLLKGPQGLPTGETTHSSDVPTRIQAYHRNHPLNILFPARAQQAIMAWGFQHSRVGGPGWRWGLYLLLKLKQRKVTVDRNTVAKACGLRLISLFGKGRSNRRINRRERARNAALLAYYVQEMGKIGGEGLVRPLGHTRLLLEPQNVEVEE